VEELQRLRFGARATWRDPERFSGARGTRWREAQRAARMAAILM